MSEAVRTMFTLTQVNENAINERLESLSAQGISASEEHSGEMNFSGCRAGYCQAWD